MTAISRARRVAVTAAAAASIALVGLLPATASAAGATASTCSSICVLDARTGAHPDYDRLVLDLSAGTLPTVTAAASTTGVFYPASDKAVPVDIPGRSYLFVTLDSAGTYDDQGHDTYTSPHTLPVALPSLKGVELDYAYEGEVQFGLSLDSYSHYAISHLTGPNRVIVDLYH
jgi:hypothetical protein